MGLVVLVMSAVSGAGAIEPAPEAGVRFLPIAAHAWAGSSVNVVANIRQSLFSDGGSQVAAFYDADGFMVLARRARDGDAWTTRRTSHRGDVADAHNAISLALDGAGYLHVAWNHHDSPLHYARSVAPDSLELAAPAPMTGERESRVTYPQFFRLPSGDLLFLYRDGQSGRGSLVLKRYSAATRTWTMVQPDLIDGEGRRSPYWGMTVDRRGGLHLAWIWRESPDVATNHDLAYARSVDGGVHWTRSDGTPLALPITAATAEYARRIPQNRNLMNSPVVATDGEGRPYLCTYWSPTAEAPPRFQIVRHDGTRWETWPGPARTDAFVLAGTGTKRPPISRAILLVGAEAGEPTVHLVYRDDARGGRIIAAIRAPGTAPAWTERELTTDAVGAWEPAFDPVAWEERREVHMLVENVVQRDGDDRHAAPVGPAEIGDLVWKPDTAARSSGR
jgi:hypothetical protein